MLDHKGVDNVKGTSSYSTPSIAEGSELFRTVMGDLLKESQLTSNEHRDSIHNASNDRNTSNLCRRCLSVRISCKCKRLLTDSRSSHRVQWADERSEGQLTREHRIDCDTPQTCSPQMDVTVSIKSILKQRANCIIIVAE